MVLWAQLKELYSLLKDKMRELTNILTPGFTEIKSKNQACGLIAHNVPEKMEISWKNCKE